MQTTKRIAIIGGGPGGLTLARILHTQGLASTVFELDDGPLARPQGGSLDLHAESGLLALERAGLMNAFRAVARYEDQGGRLYSPDGTLQMEEVADSDGDRPEVDRMQLRALLLESLPKDTIRWGSKVRGVEPATEGRWRVLDEQGSLGEFDLVVGADGTWSKVRPAVSAAVPAYAGVSYVELRIEDVDRRHPAIAALVGRGKMFAVGKNKALIAQRNSGGQLRVYAMFRVPERWIADGAIDASSPTRARADLKRHFADFAPSLLALFDVTEESIVARPLMVLPVGHAWDHRAGVTLLGDAAHVMSPFSGEGVNTAMLDATELAAALANDADWSRAVARYEAGMFVRAKAVATDAAEGLDGAVSEKGFEHVRDFYQSIQAAAAAARAGGEDAGTGAWITAQ